MDVGGAHEGELVAAQVKLEALLGNHAAVGEVGAKVGLHHLERRRGGNHLCGGIALHEGGDARGVVRLHVVNHQVVGRTAGKRGVEVAQPLPHKVAVDGVHDGNLLTHNDVGVVRHAVLADVVLPLEEIDVVVVHAYVGNALGNLHSNAPRQSVCTERDPF